MEKEGTRRGLLALNGHLLEGTGLNVRHTVADQCAAVDKLVREEFRLPHRYDPFHVLKTILKKLTLVRSCMNSSQDKEYSRKLLLRR